MKIINVQATPIEACVKIPIHPDCQLSLSTIFNTPSLRVFQNTLTERVDITEQIFPDDTLVYPSLENIVRVYKHFNP